MKKLLALLSFLTLFTAFDCESDSSDDENDNPINSCEEAIANTQNTALAFAEVSTDNYSAVCNAYKNALQLQIQLCGDPNGLLQSQIDSLGNCDLVVQSDDCETAILASNAAEMAFGNATSDNYNQLCNVYQVALENRIIACGDDGTLQAIIDDLGDCTESSVPAQDCDLVLNTGGQPDYSDYEDLVFEYAAFQDIGSVDRDDNGIANHHFRVLMLSTDPFIFNPDGSFNSINSNDPSVIKINFNSYNATEFTSGSYAPFWSPNRSNESYIDFGSRIWSDCTSISDGDFVCNDGFTFADSVVNVEIDGDSVDICFDMMINGALIGVQGTYSGVPIETSGSSFD